MKCEPYGLNKGTVPDDGVNAHSDCENPKVATWSTTLTNTGSMVMVRPQKVFYRTGEPGLVSFVEMLFLIPKEPKSISTS